jgi:hypothetical protein
MSALARDETRSLRHVTPGCVLCGAALRRAGTGRRRLYCGSACRQRAYRLRDEARRPRGAEGREAGPAEVTRLLAAVLGGVMRR